MVDENKPNVTKLVQRSKVIAINRSTYKGLKPRNKRYYVRDKKLKGFFIRVDPSGNTVYGCNGRLAGVGQFIETTIGDCNIYSIEDARQRAKEYLIQINDGIRPKLQEKIEAEKNRTILDYLEIYISRMGTNLAEETIKSYRKQIHRDFKSLNNVPITQITRDDIANWYGANVGKKGRSTDLTFTIVKTLLNYAVMDDYVTKNVAELSSKLFRRYKATDKIKPHVPLSHLNEFLVAFIDVSPCHENSFLDTKDNKLNKPIIQDKSFRCIRETSRDYILFMLLTGLRKEESARLKWSDVELDYERQIFAVNIPDNKAQRYFRFPMTKLLRAMFEYRFNHRNKHPIYVFPANTNPRGKSREYIKDPRRSFEKIEKFCDLPYKIGSHAMRRTFSTLCDELGIIETDVNKLLNQAERSVTEGYIQRSLDTQRKQYDELSDFIESNINFQYENNNLEDNNKEEPQRYGIKNFFRNHFYGHSHKVVQFNTELPKPTYWDNYETE